MDRDEDSKHIPLDFYLNYGETDRSIGGRNFESKDFSSGGKYTFEGDLGSITPSLNYSSERSKLSFKDGFVVDQEGRQIGYSVDGELLLNKEGTARLRAGIGQDKTKSKVKGTYKGRPVFQEKINDQVTKFRFGGGYKDFDADVEATDEGDFSGRAIYRLDESGDISLQGAVDREGNVVGQANLRLRFSEGGFVGMALSKEEFVAKLKDKSLTVLEAMQFAFERPGISDSAKNRIRPLTKIETYEKMGLNPDTPYVTLKEEGVADPFKKSVGGANRLGNLQAAENAGDFSIRNIITGEGLAGEYPQLGGTAKSGGFLGTQRTEVAGTRPMRGLITRAEIDNVYDEALADLDDEKTKNALLWHRATANRVTHVVGTGPSVIKKSDVNITDDFVEVKGIDSKDANKRRPTYRFPKNSRLGRIVESAYNSSESDALFDVPKSRFEKTFNERIDPLLQERHADKLPVNADTKKPVRGPSNVRHMIPKMLADELRVPDEQVEALMGHQPTTILRKNYAGASANASEVVSMLIDDYSIGSKTTFEGVEGMGGRSLTPEEMAAQAEANTEEARARATEAQLKRQRLEAEQASFLQSPEYQESVKTRVEAEEMERQARAEARQKAKPKTEASSDSKDVEEKAREGLKKVFGGIFGKGLKALPIVGGAIGVAEEAMAGNIEGVAREALMGFTPLGAFEADSVAPGELKSSEQGFIPDMASKLPTREDVLGMAEGGAVENNTTWKESFMRRTGGINPDSVNVKSEAEAEVYYEQAGYPEVRFVQPRSRPPFEMEQLGDVEYRADLDPALARNPFARLGYDTKIFQLLEENSPGEIKGFYGFQRRADDPREMLGEAMLVTPKASGDENIQGHEYTHRALRLMYDSVFQEPDIERRVANIANFEKKYGMEALAILQMTMKPSDEKGKSFDSMNEFFVELFDPKEEFHTEFRDKVAHPEIKRGVGNLIKYANDMLANTGEPQARREQDKLSKMNAEDIFDQYTFNTRDPNFVDKTIREVDSFIQGR